MTSTLTEETGEISVNSKVPEPLRVLLETSGKDWHSANNDILTVSLIVEKSANFQSINSDLYRTLLDEDLYNIVLSEAEISLVAEHLMQMVREESSFSSTIVGVLSEFSNQKILDFLLEQLQERFKEDSSLAISIMRAVAGWGDERYLQILERIVTESPDQELTDEAILKLASTKRVVQRMHEATKPRHKLASGQTPDEEV